MFGRDRERLKDIRDGLLSDKMFRYSLNGERKTPDFYGPFFYTKTKQAMLEMHRQYHENRVWVTNQCKDWSRIKEQEQKTLRPESLNPVTFYFEQAADVLEDLEEVLNELEDGIRILDHQVEKIKREPQARFDTLFSPWLFAARYTAKEKEELVQRMEDPSYSFEHLELQDIDWIRLLIREIFLEDLPRGFRFFSKLAAQYQKAHPSLFKLDVSVTLVEWWNRPGPEQHAKAHTLLKEKTLEKLNQVAFQTPKKRKTKQLLQESQAKKKLNTACHAHLTVETAKSLLRDFPVSSFSKDQLIVMFTYLDARDIVAASSSPSPCFVQPQPLVTIWTKREFLSLSWVQRSAIYRKEVDALHFPQLLFVVAEVPFVCDTSEQYGERRSVFRHLLVLADFFPVDDGCVFPKGFLARNPGV